MLYSKYIQLSYIRHTYAVGFVLVLVDVFRHPESNKKIKIKAHEFTPLFSEVRVTRTLVLCVCFVDRCLPFCTFSFGHCVVCSSWIYEFWLPLWYLQTLLVITIQIHTHNFCISLTKTENIQSMLLETTSV